MDRRNTNRYKVIAAEEDGSKTAYCFAAPVYTADGRLLDLQFRRSGMGYRAEGSSCEISIEGDITTTAKRDCTI